MNTPIKLLEEWKESRYLYLVSERIGGLTVPTPYDTTIDYPLELNKYRQLKSNIVNETKEQVLSEFKLLISAL